MGGSDAASPRYIFTHLSPFARLLFPEVDDMVRVVVFLHLPCMNNRAHLPCIYTASFSQGGRWSTNWTWILLPRHTTTVGKWMSRDWDWMEHLHSSTQPSWCIGLHSSQIRWKEEASSYTSLGKRLQGKHFCGRIEGIIHHWGDNHIHLKVIRINHWVTYWSLDEWLQN